MQSVPAPQAETFVETYRSYALSLAARIVRASPSRVDRAEVNAAAGLGLVEAASSYNSHCSAQFRTFAYYRIRGPVYDRPCKMNWPPCCSLHDDIRKIAASSETAEQKLLSDQERRGLTAALASVCRMHASSLKLLRGNMRVKAPRTGPRPDPHIQFPTVPVLENISSALEDTSARGQKLLGKS